MKAVIEFNKIILKNFIGQILTTIFYHFINLSFACATKNPFFICTEITQQDVLVDAFRWLTFDRKMSKYGGLLILTHSHCYDTFCINNRIIGYSMIRTVFFYNNEIYNLYYSLYPSLKVVVRLFLCLMKTDNVLLKRVVLY